MLISTKGRYALRVMLELAQGEPGECMPLPVIAQRQGISEKYLESIIAVLARAGLVEGQRGKGGGYRLSRELKDYSVGEIVRLTEGSLAPVSCLEGENTCPRADKCLSLPVWEKLDTLINDYLDSVSLADLLAEDVALTPEQREQVEAILRGTEQTRTYLLKIRAQVQTPLKYKRP